MNYYDNIYFLFFPFLSFILFYLVTVDKKQIYINRKKYVELESAKNIKLGNKSELIYLKKNMIITTKEY